MSWSLEAVSNAGISIGSRDPVGGGESRPNRRLGDMSPDSICRAIIGGGLELGIGIGEDALMGEL